jgi:hypothetical protein
MLNSDHILTKILTDKIVISEKAIILTLQTVKHQKIDLNHKTCWKYHKTNAIMFISLKIRRKTVYVSIFDGYPVFEGF